MRMLRKATGSWWPQKPKWPLGAGGAGVFFAVERFFADLGDVDVQNLVAVEVHDDVVAVDGDFLVVPFADRAQVAAAGRGEAVEAAVGLVVVQVFVLGVAVVEDLQLHAFVGDVADIVGCAEGEAVVAAGWELEFEPHDEVVVGVVGEQDLPCAGLAAQRAVDDFVAVGGAGPAGEVLAVEDRLEVGVGRP